MEQGGTEMHKIVSGETPEVGLRVLTNEYKWGTIVKVAESDTCGIYCTAWHRIEYEDGGGQIMNCDRLTTRPPRKMY